MTVLKANWDAYKNEALKSIDLQISDLIAELEVIANKNKRKVEEAVAKAKEQLNVTAVRLHEDASKFTNAISCIDYVLCEMPQPKLCEDILEELQQSLKGAAIGVEKYNPPEISVKFEFDVDLGAKLKKHNKISINIPQISIKELSFLPKRTLLCIVNEKLVYLPSNERQNKFHVKIMKDQPGDNVKLLGSCKNLKEINVTSMNEETILEQKNLQQQLDATYLEMMGDPKMHRANDTPNGFVGVVLHEGSCYRAEVIKNNHASVNVLLVDINLMLQIKKGSMKTLARKFQ
jgi:hypothetical protein